MMKWICAAALVLSCVFITAASVPAGATPVYTDEPPSYEMLLVSGSGVAVEESNLTFDFSEDTSGDAIPGATVTAEYRVANQQDADKSLLLALPVVTDLISLTKNEPTLTVDGFAAAHALLLGSAAEWAVGGGQDGGTSQLEALKQAYQEAANLSYSAQDNAFYQSARLYALTAPAQADSYELVVTMNIDLQKSQLIYYGFRSYQYDGIRTVRLSATVQKGSDVNLGFAVWDNGADVSVPVISYYADTNQANPLPDQGAFFTEQPAVMRELIGGALMRYVYTLGPEDILPPGFAKSQQLYDLAMREVDQAFSRGHSVNLDACITACFTLERFAFYCYRVAFPANAVQDLVVQYTAEGSMDRRSTQNPVYSYQYLTGAVKSWPIFGNWNATVIPPGQAPYVVRSAPELTAQDDSSYRASLLEPPSESLSFSLYADQTVVVSAPKKGTILSGVSLYQLALGLLFLLVAFSLVLILVLMVRNHKRS